MPRRDDLALRVEFGDHGPCLRYAAQLTDERETIAAREEVGAATRMGAGFHSELFRSIPRVT